MNHKLEVISPGEILKEEFMEPLGLTQNKLAHDIDVPTGRISEIINNRHVITADTAIRLGRYFGTSAMFWLGLQNEYALRSARRERENIYKKIKPYKVTQRASSS